LGANLLLMIPGIGPLYSNSCLPKWHLGWRSAECLIQSYYVQL